MKKAVYFIFVASLSGIIWSSCQRETAPHAGNLQAMEPVLPSTPHEYNEGRTTIFGISGKEIDNNLAQLGRVLFYDKALSVNNNMACASCHHQEKAFSDGQKFSRGFMGEETERNSMAIFNMATNSSYFWDLRRDGLEEMVLDPSMHLVEMGMESPTLLSKKIASIPYYENLFQLAFGSEEVNSAKISEALAEFISSMVANSSTFDKQQLNAQEVRGQGIFTSSGCLNCHGGQNFNNQFIFSGEAFMNGGGWSGGGGGNNSVNLASDFANIGLDYSYTDPGMTPEKQNIAGITDIEQGLFKIPSLRNVALTGPYMHDGRFATLMDVINHYDHGVKGHKNLDRRLKTTVFDPVTEEFVITNDPRKLNLSQQDKEDLIAFLTALTDQNLTTHPRFSNPFRAK